MEVVLGSFNVGSGIVQRDLGLKQKKDEMKNDYRNDKGDDNGDDDEEEENCSVQLTFFFHRG
jgi:hypothetical protein